MWSEVAIHRGPSLLRHAIGGPSIRQVLSATPHRRLIPAVVQQSARLAARSNNNWFFRKFLLRQFAFTPFPSLKELIGSTSVHPPWLRVRVSTWNVAEKTPPSDLEEFLGFNGEETPDILAVGLQEVTMRADKVIISSFLGDKWTKRLDAAASSRGLKKVKHAGLVGLALNIYVKDEFAGKVQKVSTEIVKTGFLGTVGNKGAVAVRLRLLGRSYLFINSHLPAHDDYNNARIEHANFVWDEVTEKCITLQDYVFWFGDLNFRLDDPSLSAQEILEQIEQGELTTLLNKDQLKDVMKSGRAFNGFSEMEITFKPTFKFRAGTSDYKLKRRPAWTDRVLYRAKDHDEVEIRPLTYKSLESQTVSDHRPVVAEFFVKV